MALKDKIFLSIAVVLLGLGILFVNSSWNVGKLRIVFCDVGQGDGMLIISPSGSQILVDGGPGKKILNCLGEKMPFWDRKIEAIVLTHAQKDHMEGLIAVLERYEVKTIVTSGISNDSQLFGEWQMRVMAENARIYQPLSGDKIILANHEGGEAAGKQADVIEVLWPTAQQLEIWKNDAPYDLNDTSIVVRVESGQFCAYLTGDIPKEILVGLVNKACQILKVSHHGSKTGTNQEILDKVKPEIAVVQVGKNSYGHPHKEVTELIESGGVKLFRNDLNGLVEVVVDGAGFRVITGN